MIDLQVEIWKTNVKCIITLILRKQPSVGICSVVVLSWPLQSVTILLKTLNHLKSEVHVLLAWHHSKQKTWSLCGGDYDGRTNQSQKTQGFCVADFATLSDERRSRSKIFPLFIWRKEPWVRKFEGLERSKLIGISQTKLLLIKILPWIKCEVMHRFWDQDGSQAKLKSVPSFYGHLALL